MSLPAELSCAEERPLVRLTTLEWPPYCGASLPGGGYVCRVVRQAMERAGYQVEIEFLPWNRAVQTVVDGDADGYFPEYPSEMDPGRFLYAGPIPAAPLVLAGVVGRRYSWPPLSGLSGSVAGVVRGYRNTDEFDASRDILRDFSEDDRQNVEKLASGRVDLIVIDQLVLKHITDELGEPYRSRVSALHPPLEEKTLVVAFGQNNPWSPTLARAMDRGLEQMRVSGDLARLAIEAGIPQPGSR